MHRRRNEILPRGFGTVTDGDGRMKTVFTCCVLACALAMAPLPADAKGCIKGAVVGGIAGHYAGHHGLIGAAAGCVIGRHEAKKREREMQNPSPEPQH